jgi:RNA polymerase sigma-70 factor (ECF subfamily)
MKPEKVFEILVRENADMLWAFLMSVVRDRAAADDLFQETCVTAWRNLERYDSDLPFGPWLRGIAGKLVLAHRRKSARAAAAVAYCDAEALAVLEARFQKLSARTGDTWDDKLDALRRCLERLAEPARQVIDLHYREQLSCEQIAARLGAGLESVKKRLQRARGQLAECITSRLDAAAETAD